MSKKKFIDGYVFKFGVSIVFDIFDFFLGHIPVIGTMIDIAGTFLSVWLWGFAGLWNIWEIAEITDQVDSWVPTLTIIGIYKTIKNTMSRRK